MKAFKNYETTRTITDAPKLPAGGYVCRIMAAKVATYGGKDGRPSYEKLEIAFDITEGEYKDFYKNDFDANTHEDKKWKGVLRLSVPTDNGSDADEWAKRVFRTCIEAVEDSNPGYHWDWNEAGLKGKDVGCLFRNEEWEYNGKSGWKAMPFRFIPVSDAREGKIKVPKDKPLKKDSANAPAAPVNPSAAVDDDDDDDLPF